MKITIEKEADYFHYIRDGKKYIGSYDSREKKINLLRSTHVETMREVIQAIDNLKPPTHE